MSTKIHHGLIADPGLGPFEVARRLRTALDPVRDLLDARRLAEQAATAADARLIAGEPVPENLILDAALGWDQKQAALPEGDRRRDPHRFEATLGEDPETGRLHILPFTEREEYLEATAQIAGIHAFPYWGNADAPADVAGDEWAARGRAWDRVWPGPGPAAETMLTFTHRVPENPGMLMLVTRRSPLVIERAPSPLVRARRRIVARVLADRVKGSPAQPGISAVRAAGARLVRHADAIGEALAELLPEFTWGPADPRMPEVLAAEAAALAEHEQEAAAQG